jgi:hypothetical protein
LPAAAVRTSVNMDLTAEDCVLLRHFAVSVRLLRNRPNVEGLFRTGG